MSDQPETRQFEKIRSLVPASVTLVAVSKTRSAESVESLYRLGHRDFGENYVQELLEKAGELKARGCSEIRWHFIGHLQTNKVKSLLPVIHAVHSVDSLKLAREISKHAQRSIPCFLSVNIDHEASKSGFAPEQTQASAEMISKLSNIDLRGLMCIPSPAAARSEAEKPFRALRELERSCRPFTHGGLSMGMSDDFEIAISQGSTAVRIGSAIFGARPA